MPDLRGQNREEAARQLESVFASLMVKELRNTLADGMFGSGPGADVYEGFFDQLLGESLVAQGGFGLADSILETWPDGPQTPHPGLGLGAQRPSENGEREAPTP